MISKDEYIGFDLKALFFYILRGWKLLVCTAVVAAVLCGFVGMGGKTQVNREEYTAFTQELQLAMERVENAQARLDAITEYTTDSEVMKIDHQNVYISKSVFFIDAGYKIMPGSIYQDADKTEDVINGYKRFLEGQGVFDGLSAELGIKGAYLDELVELRTEGNSTLYIRVKHSQPQVADRISQVLCEQLLAQQTFISQTIADHTISLVNTTGGSYVETDVFSAQQKAFDNLATAEKALTKQQDALSAVKSNPLYAVYKNDGVPQDNRVKNLVKWGIVGGVAGGVLAAVFVLVYSVLRKLMHAPSQVETSFETKVLGQVFSGKKPSVIDRIIRKMEGRPVENTQQSISYLEKIISQSRKNTGNVLVCSDIKTDVTADICQLLNSEAEQRVYTPAGDLLSDAHSLSQLAECGDVVLLIHTDKSTDSSIRKLLELVKLYDKQVTGIVMAG